MQYSLIDKIRFFLVKYRKIIIPLSCVLIILVCVMCFYDGYALREYTDTEDIDTFISELREKDKDIYNKSNLVQTYKDVKGIDVSSWQGKIDWDKVKDSGIDFVMIRCGFRSHVNEEINEDKNFKYNISEANRVGIPVGIYFYSTAINEKEALSEASFVLNLVKDYDITYPIVYDFELFDKQRTEGVSDKVINDNAIYFLDYIRAHGYQGMLYSNLDNLRKHWNFPIFEGYKFWYAQYMDVANESVSYDMWQYADNGRIKGIKGPVDLNEANFAYVESE